MPYKQYCRLASDLKWLHGHHLEYVANIDDVSYELIKAHADATPEAYDPELHYKRLPREAQEQRRPPQGLDRHVPAHLTRGRGSKGSTGPFCREQLTLSPNMNAATARMPGAELQEVVGAIRDGVRAMRALISEVRHVRPDLVKETLGSLHRFDGRFEDLAAKMTRPSLRPAPVAPPPSAVVETYDTLKGLYESLRLERGPKTAFCTKALVRIGQVRGPRLASSVPDNARLSEAGDRVAELLEMNALGPKRFVARSGARAVLFWQNGSVDAPARERARLDAFAELCAGVGIRVAPFVKTCPEGRSDDAFDAPVREVREVKEAASGGMFPCTLYERTVAGLFVEMEMKVETETETETETR